MCINDVPVSQRVPVKPDWHMHMSLTVSNWQTPPFWQSVLSSQPTIILENDYNYANWFDYNIRHHPMYKKKALLEFQFAILLIMTS